MTPECIVFDDVCETCDNSGYVWLSGPDGRTTMADCPNDDCNAFGQLDEHIVGCDGNCSKKQPER